MTENVNLNVKDAYEIADNFGRASGALLDFRTANRSTLSEEDAYELEKYEDTLDQMVVYFRSYGIQLIGENAQAAVNELLPAINAAKDKIKIINNIKTCIKIAGALTDLAASIMAKDPKGALQSAHNVVQIAKNLENT